MVSAWCEVLHPGPWAQCVSLALQGLMLAVSCPWPCRGQCWLFPFHEACDETTGGSSMWVQERMAVLLSSPCLLPLALIEFPVFSTHSVACSVLTQLSLQTLPEQELEKLFQERFEEGRSGRKRFL